MVKRPSHLSCCLENLLPPNDVLLKKNQQQNLSNARKPSVQEGSRKIDFELSSLSILMRLMNGEMDLSVGSYISCAHISQYILNWAHFSGFHTQHGHRSVVYIHRYNIRIPNVK